MTLDQLVLLAKAQGRERCALLCLANCSLYGAAGCFLTLTHCSVAARARRRLTAVFNINFDKLEAAASEGEGAFTPMPAVGAASAAAMVLDEPRPLQTKNSSVRFTVVCCDCGSSSCCCVGRLTRWRCRNPIWSTWFDCDACVSRVSRAYRRLLAAAPKSKPTGNVC